MANKALSKRQKMMLRSQPLKAAVKPRNPVAIAAKQRAAGTHQKSTSAARQLQNRLLKKVLTDPEE
jgi:hypothetical protein